MQCVVPLAGPQLTHPEYGLIAKYPVDGTPLLRRTLETRRWWIDGRLRDNDLIFVLREGQELNELRAALKAWFPRCHLVILPQATKGAVLSALAGAAMTSSLDEPFIIDLADILYDIDTAVEASFAVDRSLGALVPYFEDHDPCYSYLQFARDGTVAFAAEKKVISSHASAGTYLFRSAGHFIAAAGRSLVESPQELNVCGALFACPVLNSVVRSGLRVLPLETKNVRSVSKLLHGAAPVPA